MSDLKKRALTAIVLVLVLGAMLVAKGWLLRAGMSLLYVIALFEWHTNLLDGDMKSCFLDALWGVMLIFLAVPDLTKMVAFSIIGLVLSTVLSILRLKDAVVVMRRLFAVWYILWPFALLTILSQHSYYGWLVFALSFGSDTFAYLVGVKWGAVKLAPTISPNKSVEGAVGALVGTVIVAVLANVLFLHGSWYSVIILGLGASMAAQAGDLLASMFKRKCQIKDFGFLLPGHGGVLDRFDSILLVSPLIYAVIALGI